MSLTTKEGRTQAKRESAIAAYLSSTVGQQIHAFGGCPTNLDWEVAGP